MRPALLAGLALAAAPAVGLAQTGPYLAAVTDAEVKLRAGPSDQFPETATLPKGFQLLVDHEEPNGWLAVQDAPGRMNSVSWVQTQFIDFRGEEPVPQLVTVFETGTTLRAGQIGLAQPLHIQKAKVPGGTILTVIGKSVLFDGKTWYPVVPPPGDFRYLPKTAVAYDKPAATAFTVRDSIPPPASAPAGPSAPAAAIPGPGTVTAGGQLPAAAETTAGKPAVQHPLWAQAEAAERDGRVDEAEKLFFKLAQVMNEPGGDHDVANLCYTRIHTLREKRRSSSVSPTATPAAPAGPLGPPTRPTVGENRKPAPGEARPDGGNWTGPGKLVRSALALDGRRTYALETNPGVTAVYVVAGQGVDLERFVNRRVDVHGVSNSRRDLSRPYVVATAVESAP